MSFPSVANPDSGSGFATAKCQDFWSTGVQIETIVMYLKYHLVEVGCHVFSL